MTAAPSPLAGLLPDLFGKREVDDPRNQVERGRPGELRFDGLLAGLFGRTGSGDRNDPSNYSLFCPVCGSVLGVLARYRADRAGFRVIRCLGKDPQGRTCDHVTIMKDATIARVAPGAAYDDWMKSVLAKTAHERNVERSEEEARRRRDGFDDV